MSIKKELLKIKMFFENRKSYSQEGEDMVLESILDLYSNPKKGFYVDIGAYHPYRFSNTRFFYKRGWKGINIDPTPGSMKLFNIFRKRDINLNLGVGLKEDFLKFFCFDEPALNSFDEQLSKQRANTTRYKIKNIKEVQIKPIKMILDEYLPVDTKIDFMTIDVEGLDYDVLLSNDFNKYRPKVILVEDVNFTILDLSKSKVYQLLISNNYQFVASTPRTLFFKDIRV